MPLIELAWNVAAGPTCRFHRTARTRMYQLWWHPTRRENSFELFPPANPNTVGASEVRGGGEAQSEVGERRPEERQGHEPRHLRQLPGGGRPALLRPLSCSLPPPVLVSPTTDACSGCVGQVRGGTQLPLPGVDFGATDRRECELTVCVKACLQSPTLPWLHRASAGLLWLPGPTYFPRSCPRLGANAVVGASACCQ